MAKERLDKIISSQLNMTRSEAKTAIKKGLVLVDAKVISDCAYKADPTAQQISFDGKELGYSKYVYIMMNKPKGVISSTQARNFPSVIDILPDEMKRKGLFPAGRLDKDTTGFMLITDDGDFAHDILAPKKHVQKTYTAVLDKPAGDELIEEFKKGIVLDDETAFQSAVLEIADDRRICRVIINEGKYHQIKRMFAHFSLTVVELNRDKIGNLSLDPALAPGECRYIDEKELELISKNRTVTP